MQVTVQSARRHLSKKLIRRGTRRRKDAVIAKGEMPVVRLIPIPRARFRIGQLKGQLKGRVPDFLAPMDEGELTSWAKAGSGGCPF